MSEAVKNPNEGDWIDTVQGLLVAFVVAMVFRGFVLEGFVIPTGSMAPTLKGQHVRMRGENTGYAYDADAGPLFESGAAPTSACNSSRRSECSSPMSFRLLKSCSISSTSSNLALAVTPRSTTSSLSAARPTW
jgi:hypothetical protein